MKRPKKGYLLRVILSPLVFLWGLVMLCGLTVFPLPFIVMWSLVGLVVEPFIWLLRKSGSSIVGMETFFDFTKNNMINHFIGATVYFWGVFVMVYFYLEEGTLISNKNEQ